MSSHTQILPPASVSANAIDPLQLAQKLIGKASVTPADDGAMETLAEAARNAGFDVDVFETCDSGRCVKNMVAQLGGGHPSVAFVGHTDVVPPGNLEAWTHPPFEAKVVDKVLYGRGAVDMKGSIAAFVAAVDRTQRAKTRPAGTVQLWITGDEEVGSPEGMRTLL